jgi:hypothetical protein
MKSLKDKNLEGFLYLDCLNPKNVTKQFQIITKLATAADSITTKNRISQEAPLPNLF